MSISNPEDEFANLSDADINTLYEIAVLADEKPGPAFGPGLFAAYDEIVHRFDCTDEERKRYFDFVVLMGRGRRPDETALDKFVRMLQDADIAISPIDRPDTESGEQDKEEAQEHRNEGQRYSLEPRDGHNAVLSQAETLAEDEVPYESGFGIKHRAHGAARRRSETLQRRSRSEDTQTRITDTDKGWLNSRIGSEGQLHTRPRRTVSVSSNHSIQIHRPQDLTYENEDAYSADESEGSSPQLARRNSISDAAPMVQDPRQFLPPELFQRSEEEMEDDAEAFQETKAMVAQRRLFWEWTRKAAEIHAQREQLNRLAENFDRGKLLRDSFVIWREKLDAKRLDKAWEENESFYKMIEDSAVKERERNLKWVAFTHWDQSTKDERQRTSLARRHILRKKYFDAWTQVTAVNDLKVRRFVLRKFFAVWEQRLHEVQDRQVQAVAVHDTHIIDRTYKKWAFAFFDKVAPQWHSKRRQRQYFNRWRDIVKHIRERDQEVEQMRLRNVQRKMLTAWNMKRQTLQDMTTMAENLRKDKLLTRTLLVWKREAVLAPRAAHIMQQNDQRNLRSALATWNRNAGLSRQAAQVRDLRILRNSFTAWNDQLRVRFFEGQIDLRLRAEAFYKLTITLRGNVAEREYNRRVAANCLERWASKAQNRQRSIEGAEQTFDTSQRRRKLHSGLAKLSAALQRQNNFEVQAQEFRNRHLVSNALSKWTQQNASVQKLNIRADAASFYILTTRSLKVWSQATQEHRRIRKRDAYFQVRRHCKMNLAREMLRRMQIQLAHVRNMDHISAEFQEDQVAKHATSALMSWRNKVATYIEQERQAEEFYTRKLQAATLRKLVQRKDQLQHMNAQAREFAVGGQTVELMTCFRKMDRKLFQLKGQEQWALALRDKHWEKHVKNMLRYWLEQATTSRRQRGVPGPVSREEPRFTRSTNVAPGIGDLSVFETTTWDLGPLDLDLNPFLEREHLGAESTFFDNEGIVTSTPLPGYLRTPSKRNTARAKARERLASNVPTATSRTIRFAPATAPPRQQTSSAPPEAGRVITPFERKLREQGYASPSRFGRSTSTTGHGPSRFRGATPARIGFAGFEDIAEVSEERTRDL